MLGSKLSVINMVLLYLGNMESLDEVKNNKIPCPSMSTFSTLKPSFLLFKKGSLSVFILCCASAFIKGVLCLYSKANLPFAILMPAFLSPLEKLWCLVRSPIQRTLSKCLLLTGPGQVEHPEMTVCVLRLS